MTQENKFEEAKRLYQKANADQRYVLEKLFPELKEYITCAEHEEAIAWLEKQNEKEPFDYENANIQQKDFTPKEEPKFKLGEWIVWKDKYYKVNYNGCGYELIDTNGLSTSLEYETVDENAHLWTIEDAKEGDVLAFKDDSYILLVKEVHNTIYGMRVSCYCHVLMGKFETAEYQIRVDGLYPAIKEQRNILFAKMREEGFEWDNTKKELRKIEEEYNGEDYGIDSLFHAQRILEKTLGKVNGYQSDDGILSHKCAISAVKKLYRQKPTWNEEDEKVRKKLMEFLFENRIICNDLGGIDIDKTLTWLEKQCKQRPKWTKEDSLMKGNNNLRRNSNDTRR